MLEMAQSLTEEEKYHRFMERIEAGERIEADDWMPDDYREALIRLISMHAVSEIMGALPEKEWVPKAPTLHRKLAIMAKVQDEMGHGQLLLRVAEDLMKPLGRNREDILKDLFSGKLKFHNVFHMKAPTWGDAGIIAWLVDGAAIITQSMSLNSSYGPYARALQRICAEEVFHAQHGESIILALTEGTEEQKKMIQTSLTEWWPALLMFFGPRSKENVGKSHVNKNIKYKIRTKTNEDLRQEFFNKYVPRIQSIGLKIPDETIHFNEEKGEWIYEQPDWDEFKKIVTGHGPMSKERLELRTTSYENTAWVRDALANRNVKEAY